MNKRFRVGESKRGVPEKILSSRRARGYIFQRHLLIVWLQSDRTVLSAWFYCYIIIDFPPAHLHLCSVLMYAPVLLI